MVDDREFETYLEKNITVLLKDNRCLYGVFKSYDQYNSITLNFVVERIFHGEQYAERRQGLVVVRGESIVLLGLCTPTFEGLRKVDFNELWQTIENEKSAIQ
jgi:U6 snRNA-associated Sm-like protein LSm1